MRPAPALGTLPNPGHGVSDCLDEIPDGDRGVPVRRWRDRSFNNGYSAETPTSQGFGISMSLSIENLSLARASGDYPSFRDQYRLRRV